ncbi:MAG: SIR2 family NAD-dependent protein deacylase [Ilumatobacteraceae bacterium]
MPQHGANSGEAVDAVDAARSLLAGARAVAVLTGAGISTAAGIPDFRGPNGVWTKNPGAEKASTIDHYLADAETRQWAWQRRVQLADLAPQPTVAHRSLLHLEHRAVLVGLATQNIDGLHHAAGSDPSLVHEVHGSNRLSHCMSCRGEWPTSVFLDRVRAGEADPPCADCGGIVKPAVVFFGETLPRAALEASMAAAEACDVLLAAGTTLGVGPINAMVPRAKRFGASVVILNDSPTEMDHHADLIVRGDIQEVLPQIVGA